MTEVVVIGCGGVGLPLAVALAHSGRRVLGVEIDAARLRALTNATLEVEDDGLLDALAAAISAGALSFAAELAPAEHARSYVIATATPVGPDGRMIEQPLHSAIDAVVQASKDGELVAVRSTLPVGGLRRLAGRAEAQGRRLSFAACPDRTVAGRAFIEQFTVPNLIGGLTEEAAAAAAALLSPLGPAQVLSSAEAAEAAKLAANVWRDAQFALANQFALFCEAVGVDYEEIRLAGAAGFPRFAPPRAGPVGGPCLAKDYELLTASAADRGYTAPVLQAARALNAGLVELLADRILGDAGEGPVAVLGLAFKGEPPTLDRRGSIGLALAERLASLAPNLEIRIWDPAAELIEAGQDAVRGAMAVVLANDHRALAGPPLLQTIAPGAVVFDLCGALVRIDPAACPWRVRRLGAPA